MRQALDTVRMETDAQARSHTQLVNSIRRELETPLSDFMARVENLRRDAQTTVVKLFKHKHTQLQYVQRARERYESDCTKINAYTAQSNLMQGRELDKLMAKLERVQANVVTDDQDYQSYVRALQETTQKWNAEYKSFLDICQDVEEERQEFLKTNLWGLANAVSSVCVTDDEACERVRVKLEDCESIRDVQAFVREFATGNLIPPAPEYVNYAQGGAPPATVPPGIAHFARLSTRVGETMHPPSASALANTPQTQYGMPNLQPMPNAFSPMTPSMAPAPPTPASMAMHTPPGPSAPSYLATMNRTPPPTQPAARASPTPSNRNSMFSPNAAPLAQRSSMISSPGSQRTSYVGPSAAPAMGQYAQSPMVQPAQLPYQGQPAPNQQVMQGGAPSFTQPPASSSRPTSQVISEPGADDDPIARALANLRLRQSRKSPAPGSRPTSMRSQNSMESAQPAIQPGTGMGMPMSLPNDKTLPMQTSKALTQPISYLPSHMQQPPMQQQPMQQQPMQQQPMQQQQMQQQPLQQQPMQQQPMQQMQPPAMDPRWQRSLSPERHAPPAAGAESRWQQPRPSSPAAAFMAPPDRGTSPIPVEQIHSHYGQAFPTERRAGTSSPVKDTRTLQQPGLAQPARAASPLGLSVAGPSAGAGGPNAANPLARPPTGQFSESGEPILFYVKALYDYQATLPEEFSFTAGDIIAVTHTEPDGWWQGELLDEKRRTPGATTFPSNFVVLLM